MVKPVYVTTDAHGRKLYKVDGVEGLHDYGTAKKLADKINKNSGQKR